MENEEKMKVFRELFNEMEFIDIRPTFSSEHGGYCMNIDFMLGGNYSNFSFLVKARDNPVGLSKFYTFKKQK